MPVRLLRPIADQAAGTLYWGSDQAALRAVGAADDLIEQATDYQESARIVTTATATTSENAHVYRMNSASAQTLNLKQFQAWAPGTVITIIQEGAGATTIVPASGVTVNTALSSLITKGQYNVAQLIKTGAASWIAFGGLGG